MKKFNDLDDESKEAVTLMAVGPLLMRFLSCKQEDIDAIPDEIFNDLCILQDNRHPKSTREFPKETRDRIKNRLVKSIIKYACNEVENSSWPDYPTSNAFHFSVVEWITNLSKRDPKSFFPDAVIKQE